MTYPFLILICLLLILLTFFQMPKESMGLTSIVKGSDFLGSPTFVDKLIKVIIVIGIFVYMFLAVELNKNI